MRILAFLDGTLADPDVPHIRIDDLGLLRGDGIFETILVANGQPRELEPHLQRLARSAEMLNLPTPDFSAWERISRLVIDKWQAGSSQADNASVPDMALKLVYTRGVEGAPAAMPTGFAIGQAVDPKIVRAREEGLAVITLDRGIDQGLAERAPWLLLGAKSLSYGINMAAVREAVRRGAGDVIFTMTNGSVLEGPTSTVVIARGRTLITPPARLGILRGTTQAALFHGAERAGWTVKTELLSVDDLHSADGVFLTSSVRKITRVHTIDGKPLADSAQVHAELVGIYEAEYA